MSFATAGVGTIFQRWSGSAWVAIAEINSITGPSMSRDTIDVTSLSSTGGYREFIGGFRNPGTVQLSMNFHRSNYELFETDFEAVEDKLNIKQSKENMAWYNFRAKDKVLVRQVSELESEVDKCWKNSDTIKLETIANEYNLKQMERDMFVVKASQESRGLFASMLIKNQRLPMLDGFMSPEERINAFKSDYIKVLDFSSAALINSQVYTDNIFNYLVRYNSPFLNQKQRETEYIKAVDAIMNHVKQNNEVRKFIKDYLLHGFEVLKMSTIITYINKKYPL